MAQPVQVTLPNKWHPRPDQMPLWSYLERGGRRADVVAHRRWGKDDVSLHNTACQAHKRVGVYWHMLPEAAQARKAIWDAVNPRTGMRRIDEAFPRELRETTKEQDMFIRFKNGSTWQVLGSDNYNSFVGSPPIGVVLSEWSLAKPDGWNYVRPILLENGGWAVFIWTPRGRNHATRAFEARVKDPDWYTQRIPATHTPVFTPEQLAKERQELINEAGSIAEGQALYNTEYLVDFDAPVPGAYYAEQIQTAYAEGRVGSVPYSPAFPVDTMWDLGIDDYLSIWFSQRVSPNRVNFIRFYETSGLGLDEVFKEAFLKWPVNRDRKVKFGMHYLPHDVKVRELGAGGRSRQQTLYRLGVKPIRVGVARDPEERVNAVRRLLPYCHFDETACQAGLDHLKQYRKRWNQSLGIFTGPRHDEHSHAADAIGEGAVNMPLPKGVKPIKEAEHDGYKFTKSMFADEVPSWKVM
jgi:phage terminase large subunit